MAANGIQAVNSGSQGASAPHWRQFAFFDASQVRDSNDLESSPNVFKATPELSTVVSSSFGVLVADIHGSVHLLNREFESIASWVAHSAGRVTHMEERGGFLVSLGEEDGVRAPMLKIWDLKNLDKRTSTPALVRSIKVQAGSGNRPHPVSAIAISSTLSHLAVGLADGSALLYRHVDQSLKTSPTAVSSFPKPKVLHENATEPITALGFQETSDTEDQSYLALFVVTTNHVLLYQANGRNVGKVVDEVGCALGCATMDWHLGDMFVARDEAIYVCGSEGRRDCYAHEGHKSSIQTHQRYLVIVSPPFIPKASSASATVRNFVAHNPGAGDSDISKVTVFDAENRIVAYSGTFENGVRDVFTAWGDLYILPNDGALTRLVEKPTPEKLEMFYTRSLFSLALSMAKTQGLDAPSVADIYKKSGDHQYAKGDHDGAMQQYLKTIGHVQPSYVIRKFLDAQRIHNLVTYLQELHALGLANADHTTLLLNTYTKLKDVTRLDTFIKTESRRGTDEHGNTELPFDLDTAIRVCRQAGYFDHAGYLARKYERHEEYLRILIEDAGRYAEALDYLRVLGANAAESNLARYGRAMLEHMPKETTRLLIDLCTDGTIDVQNLDMSDPQALAARTSGAGASYFTYLAMTRNASVDASTIAAQSVQTAKQGDKEKDRSSTRSSSPSPASITTTKPIIPPKKLSPQVYFAHFIDHMDQFLIFLETVAQRRWGQTTDSVSGSASTDDEIDQISVWNTLLELYLTLPDDDHVLRAKALKVIQSGHIPYDTTHALILCSTRGYTEGLVLLWERLGMFEDVLRFWMDRDADGTEGASLKVVEHLRAYGKDRPSLYPLVLRFLTSKPDLLHKHQGDVGEILAFIDKEDVIPPLGVVQILSRNSVASIGLVNEWLMDKIRQSRNDIQTDEQWINSYRLETSTKLKQVDELADPERPKVFNVTRCSRCGGQLDLPSIHFMCNHSYHQRCIVDHEEECPNCAREHAVIREIRRNNEQLSSQHDVFLAEVQERGFKGVADAFSRGVMSATRLDSSSLVL